jgi:hypothetical protein
VGDTVATTDGLSPYPIDTIGVIRCITDMGAFGIEFGYSRGGSHRLDNRLQQPNGYYLREQSIRPLRDWEVAPDNLRSPRLPIPEPELAPENTIYAIGDRVVCTATSADYEGDDTMEGLTGTVIDIRDGEGQGDDYPNIGVNFDEEDETFHDCNGEAEDQHGYYMFAREIRHLAAHNTTRLEAILTPREIIADTGEIIVPQSATSEPIISTSSPQVGILSIAEDNGVLNTTETETPNMQEDSDLTTIITNTEPEIDTSIITPDIPEGISNDLATVVTEIASEQIDNNTEEVTNAHDVESSPIPLDRIHELTQANNHDGRLSI